MRPMSRSGIRARGGRLAAMLFVAVWCTARAAAPGENLVPNPDFKGGTLEQWKATFPEPNETKYARNHQWIAVVDAPKATGKAACFTLNGAVAASEGVKLLTVMMPVEKGKTYEFGADVYSEGPSPIIFIEGYQKDETQTDDGNDHFKGYARVYRATIFVKNAGGKWATQTRTITPPEKERYQPTFMLIKLYGYYPEGKVYFKNVFLRASAVQGKPAGTKISRGPQ